jgi:hypothetical protein
MRRLTHKTNMSCLGCGRRRLRTTFTIVSCLLLCSVLRASFADDGDRPTPAKPVDFNGDVRPILSNHCYACHGPDGGKRKADPPLRLDTRDGLFGERDGCFPVVPGKPDDSVVMMRVTATDDDVHMPPPKSGKPALTAAEVETLRTWIEQGAPWKDHWSYIAPTRPPVPATSPSIATLPRNDIDCFIHARLAERHLAPAPEADRATLIRRLSLDLTGLPPTTKEVDAFLRDESADAYEKVVNRLLASPRYGERMAVWWLDLVRYADSIGYHSDNPRQVWPFRDYVIKSFNENKPFDQFTIEQLAGDLLPNATNEQKVASGYNRLLQTTGEGGAQAAEYVIKYETDRVRNVSSVWLAATMGCCQCHDHKYDPFSQRDFYRMAAFFADITEEPIKVPEPELMLPSPEQSKQLGDFDAQVASSKARLDAPSPALEGGQLQWEASLKERPAIQWTVLTPAGAVSSEGSTLKVQADGSVLVSGANPPKDQFVVVARTTLKGITAFRLEALPHASLPAKGPGRAANGNFVLSSFSVVSSKAEAGPDAPPDTAVVLRDASASFEQSVPGKPGVHAASASLNADKKEYPGWAVMPQFGRPSFAVFQTAQDFGDGTPRTLIFTLGHAFGDSHSLGHFRVSATTAPRPVVADPAMSLPDDIAAILQVDREKRLPAQAEALAKYYRGISPILAPLRTKLATIEKQRTELVAALPKTLITVSTTQPREVRILRRGDWQDTTGEVVTPAVPHFMKQLDVGATTRRATRLDLAKWIVARDNPLAARVVVNRLWKLFYGAGLSTSLEDLGSQGATPTHAELLDWLACELVDSGWDLKHVVRLMVTSATYRQRSNTTPPQREADPSNEWLARQGRFRLDAEFVRDNALAISGLLVERLGGPSVYPYQPDGYWDFLNFPKRTYPTSKRPDLYRRGLYAHWQRTFLNPSLRNFDASTREECEAQRARSNTPQQALTLLDDPVYVEAARVFAEHDIRDGGADPSVRLSWAYARALARAPRADEVKVLTALLEKHLADYKADPKAAAEIIKNGEAPAPKDLDPAELAAWTSVTRTILNLHEAIERL